MTCSVLTFMNELFLFCTGMPSTRDVSTPSLDLRQWWVCPTWPAVQVHMTSTSSTSIRTEWYQLYISISLLVLTQKQVSRYTWVGVTSTTVNLCYYGDSIIRLLCYKDHTILVPNISMLQVPLLDHYMLAHRLVILKECYCTR